MSQFSGINIDQIIQRFIKDSDDAKQASLAQLDQLMSTIKQLGIQVGGTFDEALGGIAGAGEAASADAERRGQQTFAAGRQDLISSGLSSTTLGPNLRRAVAGDVGREQQRIQEGVGAQRADLLTRRAGQETQIGGMLAQAIQGVNNIGPDLGQFASLISAASAASDPNKKITARIGPGSMGGEGLIPSPRGVTSSGGGGGAGGGLASAGGGGGGGTGGGGARIVTRKTAGLAAGGNGSGSSDFVNLQQGLSQTAATSRRPTKRRIITGQLGGLNF